MQVLLFQKPSWFLARQHKLTYFKSYAHLLTFMLQSLFATIFSYCVHIKNKKFAKSIDNLLKVFTRELPRHWTNFFLITVCKDTEGKKDAPLLNTKSVLMHKFGYIFVTKCGLENIGRVNKKNLVKRHLLPSKQRGTNQI